MTEYELTARIEPFDSFWEAPRDIEKGYASFARFYSHNYLPHLPTNRDASILVISCGPGYFVNLLRDRGYTAVEGIDSFPDKIELAKKRDLPCRVAHAFTLLEEDGESWDVIFAEQELNHLTKEEILRFLSLCRTRLSAGGTLVVHSINGTSPMTGSESRSGNFDHYNSFTEYSLCQVLKYSGFVDVKAFPLDLYVFWSNPLNYVALAIHVFWTFFYRFNFRLVGKDDRIFTKKLGAVARVPGHSGSPAAS
ncbi:MAG: class I SAM-dependent methyltransferase [Gemmatimonadota bacterium]